MHRKINLRNYHYVDLLDQKFMEKSLGFNLSKHCSKKFHFESHKVESRFLRTSSEKGKLIGEIEDKITVSIRSSFYKMGGRMKKKQTK